MTARASAYVTLTPRSARRHAAVRNHVEVFVDSPWYVEQPIADAMDLTRPDEEILAETEARYKDHPSFRPFAEWRAEQAEKFAVDR